MANNYINIIYKLMYLGKIVQMSENTPGSEYFSMLADNISKHCQEILG